MKGKMGELAEELLKPKYHLTDKEINQSRWNAGQRIAELEAEVARLQRWLDDTLARGDANIERIHSLEAALNFGVRVLDEFKGTGLRSEGKGLCMCDAEICTIHDLLREFRAALAKHEPTGEVCCSQCGAKTVPGASYCDECGLGYSFPPAEPAQEECAECGSPSKGYHLHPCSGDEPEEPPKCGTCDGDKFIDCGDGEGRKDMPCPVCGEPPKCPDCDGDPRGALLRLHPYTISPLDRYVPCPCTTGGS